MLIRFHLQYNSYFVNLALYMLYCYLIIIEKETSSNEKFMTFVPSLTKIGTNFKMFTFVHIRPWFRHSETWTALTMMIDRLTHIYLNYQCFVELHIINNNNKIVYYDLQPK